MRRTVSLLFSLLICAGVSAQIVVNPSEELGPIRKMNAVNNRPKSAGAFVKALEIPYSRFHDTPYCNYAVRPVVDINRVFPDFSADPDDPASYDFAPTDFFIKGTYDCGMKPFYRLGQSIEHQKYGKYGSIPPADYKKWAVICEHIIRHYNEGWADGFNYGIEYWEIWNEADIDSANERWKTDPRCWGGPMEEFFKFFATAAKHLKKCFPELKIGGPAFAGSYNLKHLDPFLTYMEKHKVALDFFSWHRYSTHPEDYYERALRVRKMLDAHGYGDTESICDEWNYVTGWASSESEYSSDTRRSIKGAAFTAAVMSVGQNSPLDMMMYYDLRPTTSYDGVFNHETGDPKCGYYAFLSWAKLTRLGTQVAVSGDAFSTAAAAPAASSAAGSDPSEVGSASKASSESKGCPDVYVTAAKSPDGRIGILVTRYNDDDRIHTREAVTVEVKGYDMSKAVCHMTNNDFLGTEYPFSLSKGRLLCNMTPNSFMFIELPAAE